MFNTLLNINERVLNQGFWLGQVASLARGQGDSHSTQCLFLSYKQLSLTTL